VGEAADAAALSHNLLGQRLGRKGRGTRERIVAAAERLLAEPESAPVSLSAVAREASLAMTTIYLYFGDLVELLLAVLDPIMASAEQSYVAQLRTRWPDEELGARALAFVEAFHAFWARHTRILHIRNSYTASEPRMARHRVDAAQPLIELLNAQMMDRARNWDSPVSALATVLTTGLERLVTVTTDYDLPPAYGPTPPNLPHLLRAQARLLELGIRDGRRMAAG
jgi:AcrR family transcriptional regulator